MKLYYEDDLVQLYQGDCQDLLPTLPRHRRVLVLTDPPWGSKTVSTTDVFAPRTGMGGIRLPETACRSDVPALAMVRPLIPRHGSASDA